MTYKIDSSAGHARMLKEISRTKPISRKEEQFLFSQYAEADEYTRRKIKEKIIKANMRFVLTVALVYKDIKNVNIQELVSEGKIGLLEAFDKFEWKKGHKFISYAVWLIRSKIGKYLKEMNLIRIPPKKLIDLAKKKSESTELEDLDPDFYYIHELVSPHSSFDDIDNGTELPMSEILKDEKAENLEKRHMQDSLRDEMLEHLSEILDENEFTVLKGFFGFEDNHTYSLRDLGDKMNKSHERIRQIRDCGLRKLQKCNRMPELYSIFKKVSTM